MISDVHPPLVAGRDPAEVVDRRGRAGQADGARPLEGLTGRRGGQDGQAHAIEGLEAGLGEGVGLEYDIEPRDVVGVGRVGWPDADVSGFGPDPQRLVGHLTGELAEEAPVGPGGQRLAHRLGQRADLGDEVDGLESPADFRDGLPPPGRPEIQRRVLDQDRGRAELADGEVPPDHLGSDDARPIGI